MKYTYMNLTGDTYICASKLSSLASYIGYPNHGQKYPSTRLKYIKVSDKMPYADSANPD